MSFKKCTKCGSLLPSCFGHFYRQKATSDGLNSWCKSCDRIRSRNAKRVLRALGLVKKPDAEKSRAYTRKHRRKNLERVRAMQSEAQRERLKSPSYRMMSNMGRRIRDMIGGGSGSTRHLKYTADMLKSHLERQFTKGMSWENYGSFWHIDHIQPISSFKPASTKCQEFLECWSLSNMRPLEATKNLSKGDRRTHLI